MAKGGGRPRCGVLILRERVSGRGGSEATALAGAKMDKDDGCGGEYA